MAAWDARCSTCGALGAAHDSAAWRYVQQLDGRLWFPCCQMCVQNCRLGLNTKVLEHDGPRVERLVDERLAVLAEARFQNGGRDAQANQRRRLH